jgi:hypothetical protein
MKVTLELSLTRIVTIDVVDNDLNDLSRLVQQLESQHQENIHSLKIVAVDGRNVGTSLDTGSALGTSKDRKVVRFHQLIPVLLQNLRRILNSKFDFVLPSEQRRPVTDTRGTGSNTDQCDV